MKPKSDDESGEEDGYDSEGDGDLARFQFFNGVRAAFFLRRSESVSSRYCRCASDSNSCHVESEIITNWKESTTLTKS